MAYKLIMWDWNGTLANDAYAAANAVSDSLTSRGAEGITLEYYREKFSNPVKDFYKLFPVLDDVSFHTIAIEFNEGYDRHFESGSLHIGSYEALKMVQNAGIKQVIVSASERIQLLNNAKRFDVESYFDDILANDDYGAGSKVERALNFFKAQGIEPCEALMIGDTDHDAETAAAIGCDCLLIPNGHQCRASVERCAAEYDNAYVCPDIIAAAAFILTKNNTASGLSLITGSAGSGKTSFSRSFAAGCCLAGGEPVMIVPEQFSFETEKEMLSMLGAQSLAKMKIFSFTRLADFVSRSRGEFAGNRLDDMGRVAAMGLALLQLEPQLKLYGGKKQSSVFLNHLLDAVKEFKLCAITPDDLAEAAKLASGTLKLKLSELSMIFSAYEAIVAQGASDPLDDLTRLTRQLVSDEFLCGRTVIFDSFRSFTGQQLKLLKVMISQAATSIFTLCCEDICDSERKGLFATTVETAYKLKALAAELSLPCSVMPLASNGARFVSPALRTAESSMYRSSKQKYCGEKSGDIRIVYPFEKYDEINYCARECRRLVREEGYRCKDIAIFTRNEGDYAEAAIDAFNLQELPLFCDFRTAAASSATMRFILLSCKLAYGQIDRDELVRWMKTGLISGITRDDISEFENYCYIWNISGAELSNEFTNPPGGLDAKEEPERLAAINSVRRYVWTILSELRKEFDAPSGSEKAKALWHLLERAKSAECLRELCEFMDDDQRSEQDQIWNSMIAMLDKIDSMIGKTAVSPQTLERLLSMMADCCSVGHIPRGHDQISFGGAERMRTGASKVVFVLGAVEGSFPAVPSSNGVFTDLEREKLHECGLAVAEPSTEKLYEERFLAYCALCSSSELLYICCPKAGSGEKDINCRSECVDEILSIVPNARQISDTSFSLGDVEAKGAALEIYAKFCSRGKEERGSLKKALDEFPEVSGRADAIEEAALALAPALSSKSANELYGKRLGLSASKAESYFGCPFRFFCSAGLSAYPRRRVQLGSAEFGTVTHYVLEHFFNDHRDADYNELKENREYISQKCAELITKYLNEKAGGEQGKSNSFLHALRSMKGSICSLIENICRELAQTNFRPAAFELEIGRDKPIVPREIILDNGSVCTMSGLIDRVDILDGDDKYARIIDYKTGRREFKLSNVLEGLDMQMLIYLTELCGSDFENGCKPAGILYFPAYSGTLGESKLDDARSADSDMLDSARDKALVRKGILIDDESLSVISKMEPDLRGQYLPVKYDARKKNATVLSASSFESLLSPAQYDIVSRYVSFKLKALGEEVYSGNIERSPLALKYSPCDYCDYRDICRFEGKARSISKYDKETALKIMANEMNNVKEGGGDIG